MAGKVFSEELQAWMTSDSPKDFGSLDSIFGEKSFAFVLLLLMLPGATPLPTGGVTYIFEISAFLTALQMVAGRRSLWLPRKWRTKKLGNTTQTKVLPFIISKTRWLEKYSRPRLHLLVSKEWFRRLSGLAAAIFVTASFLSPPFSGLDTLPSLGVVIIALGLILEDIILYIGGIVVGLVGVFVLVWLGDRLVEYIQAAL